MTLLLKETIILVSNIIYKVINMFEKRFKSHHDSRNISKKFVEKKEVNNEYYMEKLNCKSDGKSKVLYVHVPYCDKICSFCNLNRKQVNDNLEAYTDYLIEELLEKSKTNYIKDSIFESIYFGGGTPSILKEKQLERILNTIKENYKLHEEYEWNFETTIHNLSDEKIEIFNKYGVNRLSIGIQTFSNSGRKYLNRTYSKEEIISKINKLKESFNGYICADIIYNYKTQNLYEVEEDAKLIKALNFDSVSFYSLMIHEGSKLSFEDKLEENLQKDLLCFQKFYNEFEKDEEWELLELTKFLKKGRDKYKYICLRNNGAETLGIGIGAGGYIKNISHFNISKELGKFYEEKSEHIKYRNLSGLLQFKTYSFEKIKGILSNNNYKVFLECIDKFHKNKMGDFTEKGFTLNEKGVFWGNNISYYISNKIIEAEYGKL